MMNTVEKREALASAIRNNLSAILISPEIDILNRATTKLIAHFGSYREYAIQCAVIGAVTGYEYGTENNVTFITAEHIKETQKKTHTNTKEWLKSLNILDKQEIEHTVMQMKNTDALVDAIQNNLDVIKH
jgi:hypothetical protein